MSPIFFGTNNNYFILSDPHATQEAKDLYIKLQKIRKKHVLFGQQDALSYGFNWSEENAVAGLKSDIKDVTGALPALIGWDFGGLEIDNIRNLDGVKMERMCAEMQLVHSRGGVNTLSWHMRNPVSNGNYSEVTPAVKEILPGGPKHDFFKSRLDKLSVFNDSLKVNNVAIPFIFRPWHEHNGEWFWWGKDNVSEVDFINLWRFTVNYLRHEKKMHNLIFAISPDRSRIPLKNFKQSYSYAYPGDEYVDIMGLDNYWDLGHLKNTSLPAKQMNDFIDSLGYLVDVANQHHKLAALTECGCESIPNPLFWTQILLKGIISTKKTRQIVYAMVWRNATGGGDNGRHFFAPFVGHPSCSDFIEFKNNGYILFEDELSNKFNI